MKAHLKINLRRNILRGHPWIYKEALSVNSQPTSTCLAELFDHKKAPLAWIIYDPKSALAGRLLTTDKKKPDLNFFKQRVLSALKLRQHFDRKQTNAYRLINGEGDLLPGLVVDLYDTTAVVQCDGSGMETFWSEYPLAKWLLEDKCIQHVILKPRAQKPFQDLGATSPEMISPILEYGAQFEVDIQLGQKTGFFLDQRENRYYVRSQAQGLTVLNLFSYTGGFSINAGLGHAKMVTSVDISEGAINNCSKNWAMNNLNKARHQGEAQDVFQFLENCNQRFDMVIVDPPSMTSSEKTKANGVKKYIDTFSKSAKKVRPSGHLILSSCSSHVSFQDFFEIITESLSSARRTGQILRVSGQGSDHPFNHVLNEMRYLKFAHLVLD